MTNPFFRSITIRWCFKSFANALESGAVTKICAIRTQFLFPGPILLHKALPPDLLKSPLFKFDCPAAGRAPIAQQSYFLGTNILRITAPLKADLNRPVFHTRSMIREDEDFVDFPSPLAVLGARGQKNRLLLLLFLPRLKVYYRKPRKICMA